MIHDFNPNSPDNLKRKIEARNLKFSDDEQNAFNKIKEFGIFDGKNAQTFYAQFVPDALDPEEMFKEDGSLRLYFELFTDGILDFIRQSNDFLFRYYAIIECEKNCVSKVFNALFNIPSKEVSKELFLNLLCEAEHIDKIYIHDIKLKLTPAKTMSSLASKEKCRVELCAPVSYENRELYYGIPLSVNAEIAEAKSLKGRNYIINQLIKKCSDEKRKKIEELFYCAEEGNQ